MAQIIGNAAETTVACHVRAPMLLEPIDAHVETLRACESEGAVDAVVLRSWPDKVTLADDGPFSEAVDVFRRFDRWADRRGVSVRPPFEVRSASASFDGAEKDVLVTPLIAVAVYRGDRLHGVYPHSDGEDTYTVADAIATLRIGDVPTPLGTAPAPATFASDDCPDCGGALVDGQGRFGCTDCAWTGTATAGGRLGAAPRDGEPTQGIDGSILAETADPARR